jgi:hypothetical protein
MTYEDAMDESTIVSRREAERECKKHYCDVAEMVSELGDLPEYKSKDVLNWLGY